jgi:short-subunit dehydrogenase
VITGASAGIGQALARAVAREGRPVLAVARRADRLVALSAEAAASGFATIHPLPLDITAPGAPAELLRRAEALGGAEWLVNDAGFGEYAPVLETEPEALSAMIRLNCEALVLVSRAFLPGFVLRGGFILNVASAAAFQPTPYMALYGATKALVLSFTEGLAEELRGGPAGAGAFCPGPVETEFQEVAGGRTGGPGGLSAEAAARVALSQLRGREVVRVPGVVYKLSAASVRLFPRAWVRRVSGRFHRPSQPRRESRLNGRAR